MISLYYLIFGTAGIYLVIWCEVGICFPLYVVKVGFFEVTCPRFPKRSSQSSVLTWRKPKPTSVFDPGREGPLCAWKSEGGPFLALLAYGSIEQWLKARLEVGRQETAAAFSIPGCMSCRLLSFLTSLWCFFLICKMGRITVPIP